MKQPSSRPAPSLEHYFSAVANSANTQFHLITFLDMGFLFNYHLLMIFSQTDDLPWCLGEGWPLGHQATHRSCS
jgi:hypothetical protein